MKDPKAHLSVANVLSCLALFVALSGVAYAATSLEKKSVKTKHLAKGAVTTQKLRNGAVTGPKVRNGAVTATKIGAGAVGSSQLLDGGVRSVDLGGGVVTTAKLKDGGVTTEKLANNGVTTGKLQDGAVTGAKLAPSFLGQLVKNVSYATKSSGSADTATTTKTAVATCPAGKNAIGGGAQVIGNTTVVAITKSAPPSDAVAMSTVPASWVATATDIGSAETNPWLLEAFVVCAEL